MRSSTGSFHTDPTDKPPLVRVRIFTRLV